MSLFQISEAMDEIDLGSTIAVVCVGSGHIWRKEEDWRDRLGTHRQIIDRVNKACSQKVAM